MIINKSKISSENLDFLSYDVNKYPYLFSEKENYRLLTFLSKTNNNITILDVGTAAGHSCLALAQNKNNKVISYDILDREIPFLNIYDNIVFKKMDINNEDPIFLKTAKIIFLDVDPHDGIQEKKFTDLLDSINYKGYVICDDIHLNEGMSFWWKNIKHEKYDLTEIAHWSGTGLINYNNDNNLTIE